MRIESTHGGIRKYKKYIDEFQNDKYDCIEYQELNKCIPILAQVHPFTIIFFFYIHIHFLQYGFEAHTNFITTGSDPGSIEVATVGFSPVKHQKQAYQSASQMGPVGYVIACIVLNT